MATQNNYIDRFILLLVFMLMIFGTMVIFSASSMFASQKLGGSNALLNKHLKFILMGLVVMFFTMKINYKFYKKISKILMIGSILLLAMTLIYGNHEKGAIRWITLMGFRFQPSELAKIALIIHLSAMLTIKQEIIENYKKGLLPLLIWIGIVVVLIFLQPNFSMGVMLGLLGIIIVFVGGAKLSHLSYTLLSMLPLILIYMVSAPYRRARLFSFFGIGDSNSSGTSFQQLQGIIGFGNGSFFGVGMGESKQRNFFLPESYNDFIFSIVGEEYGFIGTILLTICFILIFYRGIRIAKYTPDSFGKYLAFGMTISITLYALIHMLITLGIFPTTGLPMPFVSYGGTSFLLSCFSIGVLLNISSQTDLFPRERKENQDDTENLIIKPSNI
ncbi:MAG: cell division protein FtsW [Ignavibacteria bacterium]|nr:cell division protein FtsW [Bacteroidota bacterium]MSQ46337.1 cell division protein FtsW [Ignavibacteria bacterium]